MIAAVALTKASENVYKLLLKADLESDCICLLPCFIKQQIFKNSLLASLKCVFGKQRVFAMPVFRRHLFGRSPNKTVYINDYLPIITPKNASKHY